MDRHLRLAARAARRDQWRAALVVEILDLAVETLEAFGRNDLAGLLDRPHRARGLAPAARAAAFGATAQPVEQMEAVERRQHAAERTEEAAIGALGEQADRQQRAGVEDVRPGARELRRDRGLERLDL